MNCSKCGNGERLKNRTICKECKYAYVRGWKSRNREKVSEYAINYSRRYYEENHQTIKDREFVRYWSDPEYRAKKLLANRLRRRDCAKKYKHNISYVEAPSHEVGFEVIELTAGLPDVHQSLVRAVVYSDGCLNDAAHHAGLSVADAERIMNEVKETLFDGKT